eukprot:gene8267-5786_t
MQWKARITPRFYFVGLLIVLRVLLRYFIEMRRRERAYAAISAVDELRTLLLQYICTLHSTSVEGNDLCGDILLRRQYSVQCFPCKTEHLQAAALRQPTSSPFSEALRLTLHKFSFFSLVLASSCLDLITVHFFSCGLFLSPSSRCLTYLNPDLLRLLVATIICFSEGDD